MQSLGYNSSYLPASPPVSDSDDGFTLPISYLYASIITLPEVELRSMIMKLADSSPRFQRAIMKELSQIQTITDAEPPTVSTTPSTKQGKKRRLKSHRNPKNLTLSTGSVRVVSQTHQLDYVYHPGTTFLISPFFPILSTRQMNRTTRGGSLRVHIGISN